MGKKLIAAILTCMLALSLIVVSGQPTYAASSGKSKKLVTKVTLNVSKTTMVVGSKLTLKATVKGKKGFSKKVTWKSNKKSVATVSSKGVVKAKKKGSATITVKAADGSGKKASCKITVVDSIGIKSVKVVDYQVVKVTLTAEKKLKKSNFKVQQKFSDRGTYNYTDAVDYIKTTDNKTYYVYLEEYLTKENRTKITVSGLGGKVKTASKETIFSDGKNSYTDETYQTVEYNTDFSADVYASNVYGTISYSVKGLPTGLKVTDRTSTGVTVSGKATKKGTYKAVFTFKDELGNTSTKTVTYLVYDSKSLQACAMPQYDVLKASGSCSVSGNVTAYGGSGEYIYTIVGNSNGCTVDSDGCVRGTITKTGTVNVKVQVKDANNSKLTKTVTVAFHVTQGYTIGGFVQTADKRAISSAYLRFTNKDHASRYFTSDYEYTGSNGIYSITLPAGSYEVTLTKGDTTTYVGTLKVNKNQTKNFTANVYRVTLATVGKVSSYTTWYDATENSVGSGSILYLKPGTYHLSCEGTVFPSSYTATVTVKVTNKGVKATPKVKFAATKTITAGKTLTVGINDDYVYYKFKPTETATYTATLSSEKYCRVAIYTEGESGLVYNTGYDISVSYTLEKGKTYYIGAETWYADTCTTAQLSLKKTAN